MLIIKLTYIQMGLKPKHLPSVTQIIWEIYPFDNWDPLYNPKQMFIDSLNAEWIRNKREKNQLIKWGIAEKCESLDYDRLMKMLTTLGTITHAAAFDLWTLWFCHNYKWTIYEPYIASVTKFFEDTGAQMVQWEIFIQTEYYYWVSDWIVKVWDEYWLIDWKTWGAYKYIYWIESKILNKKGEPYSKAKEVEKVSLQLSMYKKWLSRFKIDKLKVVWITELGYFIFDCVDDLTKFNDYIDSKKRITLTLK